MAAYLLVRIAKAKANYPFTMTITQSALRLWSAYAEPYKGLPRTAWLISFGVFVNRIGSSVIYFLALYLNGRLGSDALATGWTLSMWGMGSVIGSFLGGWFCDRAGPRQVLVYGHLLSGALYLSLLLTANYTIITILAFFIGIADFALRPTIAVAMIGATDSSTRARANALRRIALNTGVAIGSALGGIFFAINPSLLFWLDGLTSLGGALIFWIIMPKEEGPNPSAQTSSSVTTISPWQDRIFILILLGDTIVSFVTSQQRNAYPLYLTTHYQLNAAYFGLLLSVNSILVVMFELPLIHYLRRYPFAWLCVIGSLCYGIGFGILPLGSTQFWVWFSWITFTLGEMLTSPASMAMVQDRASRSLSPGAYMGLFTASYSVMGFVGPGLGGWLYEKSNGTYVWMLCFVAGLISSFLFYKIARHAQR